MPRLTTAGGSLGFEWCGKYDSSAEVAGVADYPAETIFLVSPEAPRSLGETVVEGSTGEGDYDVARESERLFGSGDFGWIESANRYPRRGYQR